MFSVCNFKWITKKKKNGACILIFSRRRNHRNTRSSNWELPLLTASTKNYLSREWLKLQHQQLNINLVQIQLTCSPDWISTFLFTTPTSFSRVLKVQCSRIYQFYMPVGCAPHQLLRTSILSPWLPSKTWSFFYPCHLFIATSTPWVQASMTPYLDHCSTFLTGCPVSNIHIPHFV